MSLRSDWNDIKKDMQGAKIDVTKLVGQQDLGPTLDDYENAEKGVEKAVNKGDKPAADKARKDRKAAASKAAGIMATYYKNIEYAKDHATDPKQKAALVKAGQFLFGRTDKLNKVPAA